MSICDICGMEVVLVHECSQCKANFCDECGDIKRKLCYDCLGWEAGLGNESWDEEEDKWETWEDKWEEEDSH